MNYRFLAAAEAEFEESVVFYESREPNLGIEFILEVHDAIDRILEHPTAWPEIETEVRRCLVGRFPFGILYALESDEVLILAVMHLHRDPNSWRDRVSKPE